MDNCVRITSARNKGLQFLIETRRSCPAQLQIVSLSVTWALTPALKMSSHFPYCFTKAEVPLLLNITYETPSSASHPKLKKKQVRLSPRSASL